MKKTKARKRERGALSKTKSTLNIFSKLTLLLIPLCKVKYEINDVLCDHIIFAGKIMSKTATRDFFLFQNYLKVANIM